MKLIILYHSKGEFARQMEEYAHDFESQRGKVIELKDLETRDGSDMARLYDIVQYPSLLAVRDDGELAKVWPGPSLPLMDEVAGYANS